MRKPILILTLMLALLALVAAGCGGDDDESSGAQGTGADATEPSPTESGTGGGAAQTLKLTADPGGAPKFDKTALKAKAGKVKVVMDNPSQVPHAVEIEGNGVEEETETLTDGTADVTVDLKAGKYEFYCPVDGHRDAGMEGTLTVR
jgi:uncharacterized cupredoxin-like copper-binding protein